MAANSAGTMTSDEFDTLFHSIKNWGRWGDDDQRGALNFITPAKRLAAASLIKTGEIVSCTLPLAKIPALDNPTPVTHLMVRAGDAARETGILGFTADYFAISFHGQANTHIDALCHVHYQGKMYNGFDINLVTSLGARALSIDGAFPGIISRGILLDMPRLKGVDWIEPGIPITIADLEAAEKAQNVEVGSGDILLVRTGRHVRRRAEGDWDFGQSRAGLHVETLTWLRDREVAVLGCDGVSDTTPSTVTGEINLPIHIGAIAGLGIHLLDNCQLDDIAAACDRNHRWEFQLTVAPLGLVQGTGSPCNPLAEF